jgi:hypothetical protein
LYDKSVNQELRSSRESRLDEPFFFVPVSLHAHCVPLIPMLRSGLT